jgi:hypothetical protein
MVARGSPKLRSRSFVKPRLRVRVPCFSLFCHGNEHGIWCKIPKPNARLSAPEQMWAFRVFERHAGKAISAQVRDHSFLETLERLQGQLGKHRRRPMKQKKMYNSLSVVQSLPNPPPMILFIKFYYVTTTSHPCHLGAPHLHLQYTACRSP